MCGIFAVLNHNNKLINSYEAAFKRGAARGPDSSRFIVEDNYVLGFHRLAINGLDEASNQPLKVDGVTLICNGEIYNYKDFPEYDLKTNSDCEIIIHLYKQHGILNAVHMLDGVFAFVLIDSNTNMVHVARDPYGVRPLFEWNTGFSSELKTVPDKFVAKQFEPGCIKTYELTGAFKHKVKYTTPYSFFTPLVSTEENALELVRSKFCEAIRKRVYNTDRQIACLLSGGLDSSLVAALVNKYHKERYGPDARLETYSIGMPGSTDTEYAKMVADHIGSDHTTVTVTEQEFLKNIPTVIAAIESYDTTTVRASVGNYLIARYISEHSNAKVVFNGDGSDELAGGYMYFHYAKTAEEFDMECKRLLTDISHFDVLRSDKSISSHGLEPRTPFLDKGFVQSYLSIDRELRFKSHQKCEKYLIRKAFNDGVLLPDKVITRQKEAFSDGVSSGERSWYQIIKEAVGDEKGYYKTIYYSLYRSEPIPYYWMPRFIEASDPSARTLGVYDKNM